MYEDSAVWFVEWSSKCCNNILLHQNVIHSNITCWDNISKCMQILKLSQPKNYAVAKPMWWCQGSRDPCPNVKGDKDLALKLFTTKDWWCTVPESGSDLTMSGARVTIVRAFPCPGWILLGLGRRPCCSWQYMLVRWAECMLYSVAELQAPRGFFWRMNVVEGGRGSPVSGEYCKSCFSLVVVGAPGTKGFVSFAFLDARTGRR